MAIGNIIPSLESPFFKDLNDACCISGGQIQPAKIKFKSTTSKSKMSSHGPEELSFVETPRKFIIAELSIRKLGALTNKYK